jgi:uracil phosphoribosyltransferase
MPFHVATHPLIAHKISLLRNEQTAPHDFRRVLREITFYLGYEATRDLHLSEYAIRTPNDAEAVGHKLSQAISFIPILRAGLGMTDGMLDLIPKASIHHIGMYRTKDSLMPVQYYNKLPRGQLCDIAFILDPCIATSVTMNATISIVKKWGAKKIVVISAIGAKGGIDEVLSKHPEVEIHIAAVDPKLSSDGMILPGLGDAGDRQFCTPENDDTPPMSPTKRTNNEHHDSGTKKKGKK